MIAARHSRDAHKAHLQPCEKNSEEPQWGCNGWADPDSFTLAPVFSQCPHWFWQELVTPLFFRPSLPFESFSMSGQNDLLKHNLDVLFYHSKLCDFYLYLKHNGRHLQALHLQPQLLSLWPFHTVLWSHWCTLYFFALVHVEPISWNAFSRTSDFHFLTSAPPLLHLEFILVHFI